MKHEFKLPDIGEGIHEAELLEWRVKPGDRIKDGDEVATFNTDKVTVDLPAPCTGTVVSVHGNVGQVITVGTVIMIIERDAGAQPSANGKNGHAQPVAASHVPGAKTPSANNAATAPVAGPPPARGRGVGEGPSLHVVASSTDEVHYAHGLRVPTAPVSAPALAKQNEGPIVAAPSTRRMARELGVNLAGIAGTGPGGRILRADVEAVARGIIPPSVEPVHTPHAPAPQLAPVPSVARAFAPAGQRRIRLAGPRATSAKNLFDSVHKTATTTSTFEVMGDGLKRMQELLKPEAEKRGLKLTPMHLMAKCVAAALIRHERFNATIDEQTQELVVHDRVDLGIAVAAADRLIVPVIKGVNERLLFDVVRDIADVSQRARDNKLQVADFKGGTFTLSSTGGLEKINMLSTRPIIVAPQTAILWCSRITDRPRVTNGQLTAGPMMVCSLSFDHRYIDGAEATRFMNDLAEYLEHPEQALV